MRRWLLFCIGLVVMMTMPAMAFEDINNEDNEIIAPLIEKGIIQGMEDGLFHGNEPLTRAQAVTLLVRSMEIEPSTGDSGLPFIDVHNHWSKPYVESLWQLGLVNGKSSTSFAPDDPITFQEWVKILLEYQGYHDEALRLGGYPKGYIEIAKSYPWFNTDKIEANRIFIVKTLAMHLENPFQFKQVMMVRSKNEIRIKRFDQRWKFFRYKIYDDEQVLLDVQRIELKEFDGDKGRIESAINEKLRLDRMGVGDFTLILEMMDKNGSVIETRVFVSTILT